MAKASKAAFVCQSCGAVFPRWNGKCTECGGWNTLVEETGGAPPPGTGITKSSRGRAVPLGTLVAIEAKETRLASGIAELDRVTGGGIVPGSAILIGGEPGIGKSTLLLQATARMALMGKRTLYFTGEESAAQVQLRAARLGVTEAPVALATETNVANILATLDGAPRADLVVIDSIQTLWADGIESAPGTVSQVRAATHTLVRHAKASGSALLLVGHVTKDGQIAGPKTVEHLVDTVLYFEGDRGHTYRILRAVKNRFGATDEIGVFEMAGSGLVEIANPSELFLGDRDASAPGAAVFAGLEGTRPLLVEIQALVAPAAPGTPRRAALGWDGNRLSMLLAVLDARCGVSFSQHDVYIAVASGLKIADPAADLAAAAALLSSMCGVPLPPDQVYFGEVALSGAVRPAAQAVSRLKEAHRLGFQGAHLGGQGEGEHQGAQIAVQRVGHLKELADRVMTCQ